MGLGNGPEERYFVAGTVRFFFREDLGWCKNRGSLDLELTGCGSVVGRNIVLGPAVSLPKGCFLHKARGVRVPELPSRLTLKVADPRVEPFLRLVIGRWS
jgi:hypothetical protein